MKSQRELLLQQGVQWSRVRAAAPACAPLAASEQPASSPSAGQMKDQLDSLSKEHKDMEAMMGRIALSPPGDLIGEAVNVAQFASTAPVGAPAPGSMTSENCGSMLFSQPGLASLLQNCELDLGAGIEWLDALNWSPSQPQAGGPGRARLPPPAASQRRRQAAMPTKAVGKQRPATAGAAVRAIHPPSAKRAAPSAKRPTAEHALELQRLESQLVSQQLRMAETIRAQQQALRMKDDALAAALQAARQRQQPASFQPPPAPVPPQTPPPAPPPLAAASTAAAAAAVDATLRVKELEQQLGDCRRAEQRGRERLQVLLDALKEASREKAALAKEVAALRRAGEDNAGSAAMGRRRLANLQSFLQQEKAAREEAEARAAEEAARGETLRAQLDSSRLQQRQLQALLQQANAAQAEQLAEAQAARERYEALQRQVQSDGAKGEQWRMAAYQQAKSTAGVEAQNAALQREVRSLGQQVALLQAALDKVYASRQQNGNQQGSPGDSATSSALSAMAWHKQTRTADCLAVAHARSGRAAMQKLQAKARELKQATAGAARHGAAAAGATLDDINSELRFLRGVVKARQPLEESLGPLGDYQDDEDNEAACEKEIEGVDDGASGAAGAGGTDGTQFQLWHAAARAFPPASPSSSSESEWSGQGSPALGPRASRGVLARAAGSAGGAHLRTARSDAFAAAAGRHRGAAGHSPASSSSSGRGGGGGDDVAVNAQDAAARRVRWQPTGGGVKLTPAGQPVQALRGRTAAS